jgi:RNA polymerase sigma factor (sigma-70 family)
MPTRREWTPAATETPAPEGGSSPQPGLTRLMEATAVPSHSNGRSRPGLSGKGVQFNGRPATSTPSQSGTTDPVATDFEAQYAAKAFEFDRALRLKFKGLLSDADREELYQEAWAEFLAMLARGREVETRPDAVVYRIGERRAIDLLKRRDRVSARITSVDNSVLSLVADDAYGIDEQFEIRDEWRRCRQLIESALNERERQIFGLRYILGLPPAEVHGRFGVSPKRLEKIVGKAFKKIAAARGLVEDGTWTERQLELLVRCEAGTASAEERELAHKLVREDAKVRGMLRDLRGAVALLPLPALTPHGVGATALAAKVAAGAKAHVAGVFVRLGWRGSELRVGGGAAGGALPLGVKATALLAAACVTTGAGYGAVKALPRPHRHAHRHVVRLSARPSANTSTGTLALYRPERRTLPHLTQPTKRDHRRHKRKAPVAGAPPPAPEPAAQAPAPLVEAPATRPAPTAAPASGTGEFGP